MVKENEQAQVLMKHNTITKAKYNITTIENRIFQMVMYKLQKDKTGLLTCHISLQEFKAIIKGSNQSTAEAIGGILEGLRKQPIYFKQGKEWGVYGFINGFVFNEENNTFTIEASERVHSLLKDYQEAGYTPVNLPIFLALINSYAQRFYDLLRLWSGSRKVINYEVEELKELLMLESKYDRYPDFKRRIIVPAIKELTKSNVFKIEVKENKVGRKVVSIDFIVEDLDKRKYFDDVEPAGSETDNETPSAPKETKTETVLVPEDTVLTKGALRLFKKDFAGIDFTEGDNYMNFVEAEAIALDKDNVEEVGVAQYGFFKGILKNKLEQSQAQPKAESEAEEVKEDTTEEATDFDALKEQFGVGRNVG